MCSKKYSQSRCQLSVCGHRTISARDAPAPLVVHSYVSQIRRGISPRCGSTIHSVRKCDPVGATDRAHKAQAFMSKSVGRSQLCLHGSGTPFWFVVRSTLRRALGPQACPCHWRHLARKTLSVLPILSRLKPRPLLVRCTALCTPLFEAVTQSLHSTGRTGHWPLVPLSVGVCRCSARPVAKLVLCMWECCAFSTPSRRWSLSTQPSGRFLSWYCTTLRVSHVRR